MSAECITNKEFMAYQKERILFLNNLSDRLNELISDGDLLGLRFCHTYELLLTARMDFCRKCSDYYCQMAERSFWFMRPRVLRMARQYEMMHNDALGRLLQVKIYEELHYPPKGYND